MGNRELTVVCGRSGWGRPTALLAALLVLLTAAPALAAGGAAHKFNFWKDLFFPWANLLLLIWLGKKFLTPVLRRLFLSHHEEVKAGVASFEERDSEVANKYRDVRERLAKVDDECARIVEETREDGEIEKSRTIERAEAKAKKLIEDVERTRTQEMKATLQKLRQETSVLAIREAEKVVLDNITEEDRAQLSRSFLKRLEEAG